MQAEGRKEGETILIRPQASLPAFVVTLLHRSSLSPGASPSQVATLEDDTMEDTKRGKSRVSLVKKAAKMDRAIWSDLPKELLQCVFARLPLAGIFRLRCLSKQWNRILNSHGFKQECTDAHPKMFGIISPGYYSTSGSFKVWLYDLRSDIDYGTWRDTGTWHAMQIDTGYPRRNYSIMNASDGGLVCFACIALEEQSVSVLVLVCNPLTRVVRALPLHSRYNRLPEMLHLVMDRVSKCYQVLIVSTDRNGGGLVAEVFHSNIGAWTTANLAEKRYFPGFRDLDDQEATDYRYSDVYDCVGGRYLEIPAVADLKDCWNLKESQGSGNDSTMTCCLLVHDRLFALCRKDLERGSQWFFAEFQYLESGARWLKVKNHRSIRSSRCFVRHVLACKGFMVVAARCLDGPSWQWAYDLSTGKWHNIYPNSPETNFRKGDIMCELQWDAIP